MQDPVTLKHVSYTYAADGREVAALRDVNLEISAGEIVAIVGPSGAGKTTLLRLIAGLMYPTTGEILIGGDSATAARARGRIAVVFQQPALLAWRTVEDNVALPLELTGETSPKRVADVLRMVGLEHFSSAFPRQLSGGMQSRASLARALVMNPGVLLLDEPFGSLDELTAERLNTDLLETWQAESRTIVIVTHSVQQAVALAHRVVVLSARPGAVEEIVNVPLPSRLPIATAMQTSPYLVSVAAVRAALWRGADQEGA